MQTDGKKIEMNLLDMPGIATKIDFEEFVAYGLDVSEAQERAQRLSHGEAPSGLRRRERSGLECAGVLVVGVLVGAASRDAVGGVCGPQVCTRLTARSP